MPEIYILCPGDIVSGGVNSLHLLCKALINNNYKAGMVYLNPQKHIVEGTVVKSFDVPQFEKIIDTAENLLVVPETLTSYLPDYKYIKKSVYWLSVHFFFKTPPFRFPFTIKLFRKLISCKSYFDETNDTILKLKRNISYWNKDSYAVRDKSIFHITNSYYIASFLKTYNIENVQVLHNPVRDEFYEQIYNPNREKIILVGPKTSKSVIKSLKLQLPVFQIIRVKRISSKDLFELYQKSLLFIELGHSNRDRSIREAALSGCVILYAKSGGAGLEEDTPLPDDFKIDTNAAYFAELTKKVTEICTQYTLHYEKMKGYLSFLQNERNNFTANTKTIFGKFLN